MSHLTYLAIASVYYRIHLPSFLLLGIAEILNFNITVGWRWILCEEHQMVRATGVSQCPNGCDQFQILRELLVEALLKSERFTCLVSGSLCLIHEILLLCWV